MKTVAMLLLTAALTCSPLLAGERTSYHSDRHFDFDQSHLSDVDLDIDRDGTIIIEAKHRKRQEVEITKEFELFINGDQITLDEDQRKLVEEYYLLMTDLIDQAKAIGLEGAKVGVEGAKLGLTAVGKLFKLLSPRYDTDDYEREIEDAAERLEMKAEKLEEKAEIIEDIADDLDDLAHEMRREIPEIRKLRWF